MADCPHSPGQPCDGKGPRNWSSRDWCLVIAAFFAALGTFANGVISGLTHVNSVNNSQKLDEVHGQQVENAKEVKDELKARAIVTDQKLGTLQKSAEKTQAVAEKTQSTVADTLGPQLLAAAKYLQELADYDPKDATAAARAKEAKKIYDDYMAKQKPKP